ncbi:SRPBCC family protein [Nonomuraea turcica]|uniref:SRPBCC family protein n=1 Tax=Nonomuraea sp. G32 TaxID=3067274 RepID=UPI00273BE10B|nr:SRPBCC family protein [Nonomuraea sp. G32]MDP4503522.1 SRPBCC family protein [Nonomuraea sp. G32]
MAGSTDNSVWIDAPFDVVWKITNDLRNWPSLFTEYASIDVLEEEGNTATFRLTMVPDPDGSIWSWVSKRTWDKAGKRAAAHRVETGPFEYMKIYWDYAEENGGTRMRWQQEFAVKPEAPFDLASITDRINKNTKIQMAVIKEKVEQAAAA